jgi:biotin carboxyl carrier protein
VTPEEILVDGKAHRVAILERSKDSFLIEVNDKTVRVDCESRIPGKIGTVKINGQSFNTRTEKTGRNAFAVEIDGKPFNVRYPALIAKEPTAQHQAATVMTRRPPARPPTEKNALISPLAGRIVLFKVRLGEEVQRGNCVCILEAMKMENEILAPRSGVVREIRVGEGDIVDKGATLAVIS